MEPTSLPSDKARAMASASEGTRPSRKQTGSRPTGKKIRAEGVILGFPALNIVGTLWKIADSRFAGIARPSVKESPAIGMGVVSPSSVDSAVFVQTRPQHLIAPPKC
jgi:hypothetical protein